MVPFECDLCVFRKVSERPCPDPSSPVDRLLQACIRRVILDAFWSRAESTVNGNTGRLRLGIRLSATVGLGGPYVHDGPLPGYDHCGYEVAIQMVLYSRRAGVNAEDHLQMETIRKLRTVFGNQVRASPQATRESLSLGDQKGHYQRLGNDASGSFWFSRFYQGCAKRMGQIWRPNRAMSTELYLAMLAEVEARILGATTCEDLNAWIVFHSYVVVAYVVSLRGTEGLLLDLGGLQRHWDDDSSNVVIALLGKVKGENGDRAHLLPCVAVTSSGVKVKASLERLLGLKERRGFVDGPAISDINGVALSSSDIDDLLHEVLEELFVTSNKLFPPDIANLDELQKAYQAFRTLRRTSDTQAIEQGVSADDINIVNRWHTVESAHGNRPQTIMRHRYAQFEELLAPFLRYTAKM